MINIAYAMGEGAMGSSTGASGFASFIPLILMLVIFYFLLIRPQQKKNKEHRNMIDDLKIGDKIIISSGIHGRITNVSEETIIVEIADKVKVKINKGSVSAVISNNPSALSKNE